MIRNLISITALTALVACGDGAPFGNDVTDPDDGSGLDVPTNIASTVTAFSYNPGQDTMTLTGTLRDGDASTTTFARRANLDVGDYEAYTAQDDALDEHTTIYVRNLADVRAAAAVTGGQFTYYSGGALYSRSGGFDAPPINEDSDGGTGTGLVTYAGDYAGLTNLNGQNTDLQATTGTVDPAVLPAQAGPVTGKIFINVSFADNNMSGVISQRRVSSDRFGEFNVSNLILVPTALNEDGSFTGEVELPGNRIDVGEFAGVIGSNDGEAMAGAIFVSDHFDDTLDDAGNPIVNPVSGEQAQISGEEEFGIFVLGRCGGPSEDTSSTECDNVDPL